MSWNFYMERTPEPDERIRLDECEANYTYNVSPMFYDALACRDGIRGLDGAKGKDAYPLLAEAIAKMEADPAKYRAMNPKNGWGDYDGALKLLRELKTWCAEFPEAFMVVH
jgi:hypothetical protein